MLKMSLSSPDLITSNYVQLFSILILGKCHYLQEKHLEEPKQRRLVTRILLNVMGARLRAMGMIELVGKAVPAFF